jgi:hypothetical protein
MSASFRSKWPLAAALVIGAAGALAGCNLIVGSYAVGRGATESPVDGGDDGGSTVEDAGAVGDDSSAGDSSPGDGGAITTKGDGATPQCGSTPFPTTSAFQQLVTACVLAGSCDPQFFATTISDCISRNYLGAFGSLACLSNITSCADYYACENYSVATAAQCPASANQGTDVGTCNAGTATTCFYGTNSTNAVYNCPMLAGSAASCTVYNTDSLGDQAAGCSVGSCSDPDGTTNCLDSAHVYTCYGGVAIGQICPSDSACGTIDGSTSCYFNAPACTTQGATCNSGTLNLCAQAPSIDPTAPATNQSLNFNCGVAGLSCETDGAGSGSCVSPGCDQSTCTESCGGTSGNVLSLCIGGAPYTAYDCTAHGFAACGSSPPPGSTTTYAY